ncbi:hypothetical protein Trydic_g13019 [Trypoxylus dichotomus]
MTSHRHHPLVFSSSSLLSLQMINREVVRFTCVLSPCGKPESTLMMFYPSHFRDDRGRQGGRDWKTKRILSLSIYAHPSSWMYHISAGEAATSSAEKKSSADALFGTDNASAFFFQPREKRRVQSFFRRLYHGGYALLQELSSALCVPLEAEIIEDNIQYSTDFLNYSLSISADNELHWNLTYKFEKLEIVLTEANPQSCAVISHELNRTTEVAQKEPGTKEELMRCRIATFA